jgi:hypothetical protein
MAKYIENSRLGEDDSEEEDADEEDEVEVPRQLDGVPAIGPVLRSERYTYNLWDHDWLGVLVE